MEVTAYSVRVKKKYSREGAVEILDNIDDAHDFFEIVSAYLEEKLDEHQNHEEENRTACLTGLETDQGQRSISGTIQVGKYGEVGKIVDAQDGTEVFKKRRRHSDTAEFSFHLRIPNDTDEAILVIAKSRRFGVKAAFMALLDGAFQEGLAQFRVTAKTFMNEETFEHYINEGHVKSIHFIQMGIMQDFADNYDTGHGEVNGTVEFIVKASRNQSLPLKNRLRRLVRRQTSVENFYEIADDFRTDKLKVDVLIGNRMKKVDFARGKSEPIYELEGLEYNRSGEPVHESVMQALSDFTDDLMQNLHGNS
jgi:hypothetical protein